MSSEIVPGVDDGVNERSCGSATEGIGALDLLGLRAVEKPKVQVDLTDGNHHTRLFIPAKKGHQYITELNPTPDFVQHKLECMREPSVMLLRGCDQLSLQSVFHFEKFKTLTLLEISGFTNLTTLPDQPISELTQLQHLNLSNIPIQRLQDNFFSNLTNLRSLVLSGCSDLQSLPEFPELKALEFLDLSHLLIETLPEGCFSNLENLHRLILRGCSKLLFLPSIKPMKDLEALDISHCTALPELVSMQFFETNLKRLDLSYTAFQFAPDIPTEESFSHLYLRNAKVIDLKYFNLWQLEVLDLSGADSVKGLDQLRESGQLVALDLSRTGIESVDFISDLGDHLRYLILRECTMLVRIPALERLTELEVLDLSGCEMLVDLPEDLSSLDNLKELNLSGCTRLGELREGLFDKMSCLEKLHLSKTNLANELHLVSSFCDEDAGSIYSSGSAFDTLKYKFGELAGLFSTIQEKAKATTNISSRNTFQRQYETMLTDLNYIRDSVDLLESSRHCTSAEKLVRELLSATEEHLSPNDFPPDSPNVIELFRMVVKLKLLVPPKQAQAEKIEEWNMMSKRKFKLMDAGNRGYYNISAEGFPTLLYPEPDINGEYKLELTRFYGYLTDIQKSCLLYFSALHNSGSYKIKERTLVQLWYGEGFIDPNDANPNSTVEEIGHNILMALIDKGFIKRSPAEPNQPKYWRIDEYILSFVKEQAKAEQFFDFNSEDRNLTPHLTASKRACLLKSRENMPSSCSLWRSYTDSSEKIQRFKTVRTLLNVDENLVYIRAEWFSKMRNLWVLHIGRWDYDGGVHVEVVDLKFLEESKNMKQLRLLSLEGFSSFTRLPDVVCKLTSLKILNLRGCVYLEEIPDNIGSLKNLTHLDLVDCHAISMLPKGLRFLSKLEVLKGFVISYQIGGQQHSNACTLQDLSKLERLRMLKLSVNRDVFPDSKDLEVFKELKNLHSLKITWEKNYDKELRHEQKALKHSRWKQVKFWEQQTRKNDTKELSTRNYLDNLRKLVMVCFPLDTAPSWLHPSGLQKLEKLYMMGGKLKTLVGDSNQMYTWNVKTMRLTYLDDMYMEWGVLRCNFDPTYDAFGVT